MSRPAVALALLRPAPVRYDRLDAMRGVAMVWMSVFHLSFDLNLFGWLATKQDFYRDPFWLWQRTAIVTLFLVSAGIGQAVAIESGQLWPRFWRRWAQVAGCAVLVSAGSAVMFPHSWISFGVLHGIAVMLLVVRLASPSPRAVWWLVGAVALALPSWLQHPLFDTRWTNWVGLVTHKPVTEDYVPLLPWLGVMVWATAGGRWLLAHKVGLLAGDVPALLRPLARLGRWPLTFYMVHQPVFIGLILAARQLGVG